MMAVAIDVTTDTIEKLLGKLEATWSLGEFL